MTIHEIFEQHYADQYDTTPEIVASCRLSNGSYNNLPIARAFRMFRAGFEANKSEKMQVLGYLSKKGALSASEGKAAMFYTARSHTVTEAIYIKQSEAHKTGEQ